MLEPHGVLGTACERLGPTSPFAFLILYTDAKDLFLLECAVFPEVVPIYNTLF